MTLRLAGLKELAALCAVEPGTVYHWRTQRILPEPDWTVSGTPIWRAETLEQWARATGRLV